MYPQLSSVRPSTASRIQIQIPDPNDPNMPWYSIIFMPDVHLPCYYHCRPCPLPSSRPPPFLLSAVCRVCFSPFSHVFPACLCPFSLAQPTAANANRSPRSSGAAVTTPSPKRCRRIRSQALIDSSHRTSRLQNTKAPPQQQQQQQRARVRQGQAKGAQDGPRPPGRRLQRNPRGLQEGCKEQTLLSRMLIIAHRQGKRRGGESCT